MTRSAPPDTDEQVRWYTEHTALVITTPAGYNLALGERRARAARDYLASVGVPDSRITVVSYREERPTCGESTEACWAQNRRAHFLVKE